MPWVAAQDLHISGVPYLAGTRLPHWIQRDRNMIRVLKSLHGEACVRWVDDGPSGPVPEEHAVPAPPPAEPFDRQRAMEREWAEWWRDEPPAWAKDDAGEDEDE